MNYPIRILYIEDDKLFRELIKKILKDSTKYIVDVAEDGKDGIKLALDTTYDIVLMDIMMPNIDGVKASYVIKILQPTTKIIAVTALDKNDIISEKNIKDENYPINYYMRKPIYSNILIQKIEDILK